MYSRRGFIGSAAMLAGASAVSGRSQAAGIPEAATAISPATQPPLAATNGQNYQPVVTLNGWTLPWRMNGDWKEYHLVAEPVVRELAPGMKAHLWGYNGQSPGPTIEAGGRRQGSHLRHQQAARAHDRALARHAGAQRHGWRRRIDPAPHRSRQDLCVRVRAQAQRHVHVPPAFRRDGADGDGHDGKLYRASTRPAASSRRSRLCFHHELLRYRPGRLAPEGHDH